MDEKNNAKFYKLRHYATVSVCVLLVCAAAYLLIKYALPIFIPFLIAFLIGSLVSPIASRLSEKTKIPRGVWGFLLTSLLLTLTALLLAVAFDRLIGELVHLAENLNSEAGNSFIDTAADYLSSLTSKLPILRELRRSMGNEGFWNDVDAILKDSLTGTVTGLAKKIPEFLGDVAKNLPEIMITVIVTLIATFYFSSGKGQKQVAELLPESVKTAFCKIGGRFKPVAIGWMRAYLLIFIITFAELFVGLSVLRVKYAFLAAAIIAVIDFLPILGTGTVLIPWSVIAFLMKDARLGAGLLVLFGIITVVREVIEPKLIGKNLGLPPILTLIAMYAGLKLFGFVGMIFAPAALMLFRVPGTSTNNS